MTTKRETGVGASPLVRMRRWLHQHAELSFHERQTARYVLQQCRDLGLECDYQGEGSAVIARLTPHTNPMAPGVALRCEMDALPGFETTGVEYASVNEGVVHACGHAAHMAMVLGAAASLSERPPNGNVAFIFQPAEENGGGSRVAIKQGALRGVGMIFAGHVTHDFVTGQIMIGDGVITSQSDRFEISVTGKGGHGARPHEATDAVVIAGFLIAAIQTLVSREVDPVHPSVVTIGTVQAGSAPNVIAETATLAGSIRTTETSVREHIHNGLQRMVDAVGILHDAQLTLRIEKGYPPVVNDAAATRLARGAALTTVGQAGVMTMNHPSMGSEDFSFYLDEAPGCFVRFGARCADWRPVPLHSPGFNIDEGVLPVGARYFDTVVRAALDQATAP